MPFFKSNNQDNTVTNVSFARSPYSTPNEPLMVRGFLTMVVSDIKIFENTKGNTLVPPLLPLLLPRVSTKPIIQPTLTPLMTVMSCLVVAPAVVLRWATIVNRARNMTLPIARYVLIHIPLASLRSKDEQNKTF